MFIDFSDHGFSTHHTSRQGPLSGRTDDGSRLRSSEWLISFHAQLKRFQHQHLQQHQHLILQHDQFSRPKDPVQRHRQPDLPVPPPPYSQPTLKYTKSMPILTSGISSKSWVLSTNDGADESRPFSTIEWRLGVLLLLQKVTKTPTFYLMLQ